VNGYHARLHRVALLGVADLLWPRPEYGDLAEDVRLTSAERLVSAGEPLASHYYQVVVNVAAAAAKGELQMHTMRRG
jgi:hypothetical protein